MLAKYSLVLQTEPEVGKSYPLGQQTNSLGRDRSNGIVINHPEISRNHCEISYEDGTYFVEDTGSLNGTFLDGEKVVGRQPFYPGVVLGLGGAVSAVLQVSTDTWPDTLTQPAIPGEQTLVEPVEDAIPTHEPIVEIPEEYLEDEEADDSGTFINQRLLIWVFVGLLILLIIGAILFLWFIDTYSLWCQVLPFLFEPGVCP